MGIEGASERLPNSVSFGSDCPDGVSQDRLVLRDERPRLEQVRRVRESEPGSECHDARSSESANEDPAECRLPSSFVALAFGELLGDFVAAAAALDRGRQAWGDAAEQCDGPQAERGDVDFGDVVLDSAYGCAGDVVR